MSSKGMAMIDRRTFVAAALVAAAEPSRIARAEGNVSRMTAYAFSFPALSGADIRLADFSGRPMLIVNTASLCGYTPQYAGLQELWSEFRDRGLVVIGVPSNDFGGQEPGSAKEIAETAQHHYGVTFPIAGKATVKGPDAHPFYKWAEGALGEPAVPVWNFHKILIGKDGQAIRAFGPRTDPQDSEITAAIEAVL